MESAKSVFDFEICIVLNLLLILKAQMFTFLEVTSLNGTAVASKEALMVFKWRFLVTCASMEVKRGVNELVTPLGRP